MSACPMPLMFAMQRVRFASSDRMFIQGSIMLSPTNAATAARTIQSAHIGRFRPWTHTDGAYGAIMPPLQAGDFPTQFWTIARNDQLFALPAPASCVGQ